MITSVVPSIGGSKGAGGQGRAPGGLNSFIFMQFSAKILQNHINLGVGGPSSRESWIRHYTLQEHQSFRTIAIF